MSSPSGAAPENTIRIRERSNSSTAGFFTMPSTMGGTSGAVVTRYFSSAPRNSRNSNRGMLTTVPPRDSVSIMITTIP